MSHREVVKVKAVTVVIYDWPRVLQENDLWPMNDAISDYFDWREVVTRWGSYSGSEKQEHMPEWTKVTIDVPTEKVPTWQEPPASALLDALVRYGDSVLANADLYHDMCRKVKRFTFTIDPDKIPSERNQALIEVINKEVEWGGPEWEVVNDDGVIWQIDGKLRKALMDL